MQNTIKKYREYARKDEKCSLEIEGHTQQLKHEAAIIQQKLEQLEASQRKDTSWKKMQDYVDKAQVCAKRPVTWRGEVEGGDGRGEVEADGPADQGL
ncbi:hypothetical protein E3N88_07228 [Mikania micrantha]|uniref:Uncharacterized protein n=1 Tax=Mikania micrantha TaxID=192012 RepID=A0A5N6PS02_9ASTR|nr:hypothetical protein E3N88_07228 [Mikania micrantha]